MIDKPAGEAVEISTMVENLNAVQNKFNEWRHDVIDKAKRGSLPTTPFYKNETNVSLKGDAAI